MTRSNHPDESTISGKTSVAAGELRGHRDPLDPLVGRLLAGRFRLDDRIAAGGFGAIYRGTHASTGRTVAIKVLHPEWATNPDVVARFRREAATLTSLRHHNTVTTYEAGETPDGTLFIVMELLRGESLYTRFRERGPLPYGDVVAIARQICASLAEAHALGIVHRDLKPANIHLEPPAATGGELVKVLDFGIAKIMRGSNLDDGSELTNVGQMIGTFDYMSPEQILGGLCQATSDVYTLGVIMYEIISGSRPFAEVPGPAMVAALLTTTPPSLASRIDVPPELDRIVMRCLAREAHDRYPNVAELANDLARLAHAADTASRPTSMFETPAPSLVRPADGAHDQVPYGGRRFAPPAPELRAPPPQKISDPLLARGSQPAFITDDATGTDVPTAIARPPGGVWRTVPAQPPIPPYVAPNSYVPAPHQLPQPQRASTVNLPTFTLDTSTNAWVGRAVWVLVIILALVIAVAVRSIIT